MPNPTPTVASKDWLIQMQGWCSPSPGTISGRWPTRYPKTARGVQLIVCLSKLGFMKEVDVQCSQCMLMYIQRAMPASWQIQQDT